MGGSVGLTIRTPEDIEYRMCRWTNILSWAVTNTKLLNKDSKHLDEILFQWKQMETDYNKHKKDKQFEFPMTECYISNSYQLVPIEYGIVVVDMVNNVILTNQQYISLDRISSANIGCAIKGIADKDVLTSFKRFYDTGRIKTTQRWDGKGFIEIPFNRSWSKLIKECDDISRSAYYILDMSPFVVEEFKQDTKGNAAFVKRLKQLKFKLSKSELKEWR